MLRRGNHASAKFWRRVLLPVIDRYRHCDIPKFFRGDAAFAEPALYVTNLAWRSKRVVRFYNGRGTAEQWIKEGRNAVKWTKLSCRTFKDNQARLQLFGLAYNLANFLRRLALPKGIRQWSLTTLREKLSKDRCEGDVALKVCILSTGGGRRAATTIRSDSGADRTTCDSQAVCRSG